MTYSLCSGKPENFAPENYRYLALPAAPLLEKKEQRTPDGCERLPGLCQRGTQIVSTTSTAPLPYYRVRGEGRRYS